MEIGRTSVCEMNTHPACGQCRQQLRLRSRARTRQHSAYAKLVSNFDLTVSHNTHNNAPSLKGGSEKGHPNKSYVLSDLHITISLLVGRIPLFGSPFWESVNHNNINTIPVSANKQTFPRTLATRPSSRNCNPASDLVLSKLNFQPVFSSGVFFEQTPVIMIMIMTILIMIRMIALVIAFVLSIVLVLSIAITHEA